MTEIYLRPRPARRVRALPVLALCLLLAAAGGMAYAFNPLRRTAQPTAATANSLANIARPAAAAPPAAPTPAPIPTATPAAQARLPQLQPDYPTPVHTPLVAIPQRAAQLPVANGQLNLLLLGTDVETAGDRRADSIVLVALHTATGQVNLVSLPRDLYVYLPGNSMGTINTAVGSARFAPDGALALAQQTVLYNFGFAAHYVVWVDIPAFIQIVDTLGGIEVPVPCDFSDRILKAPGLDAAQPRNWAEFRVRPGLQKMDGATAQWYARLRYGSDDQDRSRRQQDVLRAIVARLHQSSTLLRLPALYRQFASAVQTNMQLGDVLQFVPLAVRFDGSQLRGSVLRPPLITRYEGDAHFPAAYLPNAPELQPFLQQALALPEWQPPPAYTVELLDRSGWAPAAQLAAQNVRQLGLQAAVLESAAQAKIAAPVAQTIILNYTGSELDPQLPKLRALFHLDQSRVEQRPITESPNQFQVILGRDYNSCPLVRSAPQVPPASDG